MVTLLRNLGVNETIIQALQKSYGEEYEELEIRQDKEDLIFLLIKTGIQNTKPQILTLPGFFKKNSIVQTIEPDIALSIECYNCNDTLEFMPESVATKDNLKINGVGLRLSDCPLKLLCYLAKKSVDNKMGWVYIQDIKADGVIPSDGYQSFSRLRSAIAGYLLKKNAKDLIEANGRKQYRLSLNPEHIIFPTRTKT